MRSIALVALSLASSGIGYAGALNIRLMMSEEVAPGVYGQVQFGNETPPPVVYARRDHEHHHSHHGDDDHGRRHDDQ